MTIVTPQQLIDAADRFPLREAHREVTDLMEPNLARYFVDTAVTALAGWAALLTLNFAGPWAVKLIAWAAATYLLYRSAVFIHELVHMRSRRHRKVYGRWWNLLVGYPLLIPYFLYDCHAEHHSKRLYGTIHDAEYLPYAQLPRSEIVKTLVASPFGALFGVLRFGIVPLLAWFSPRIRAWSWTQASSIKLDLSYDGHPPRNDEQRRLWLTQETVAFVVFWAVIVLAATGVLPWSLLGWWLVVLATIVVLNSLRLLGAHRYHGNDDENASLMAQMIDTVNISRNPVIGSIWGPIGLRLHALHHLFPSLPYHNYNEAHRRLLHLLPDDSAYHLVHERSLGAALMRLWRAPRPGDAGVEVNR